MGYDLSDTTASNGKPNGKFTLRCVSAKIKKSKGGDDMFALEFRILGEEFGKSKLVLKDFFMLQGNGAQYAKPKLAFLMDKIGVSRSLDNVGEWLNKNVDAKVIQDGEGYNKIADYFDPSAVAEDSNGGL